MLKLLYWSATGLCKAQAERLGGIPIHEYDGNSEYILMFPSYGAPRTGNHVPPAVKKFLKFNGSRMRGVVGFGNIIFGPEFCLGAVKVAKKFQVPVVASIDMVPTDYQEQIINNFLEGQD